MTETGGSKISPMVVDDPIRSGRGSSSGLGTFLFPTRDGANKATEV